MTVLNEILQGCFELRDANGLHLVAKPKTFSAKEVDLWVENVRHAVSMLQGEVRMKGWVLAPEAKTKPRNKTALDAGIEKDIVIHAVAHNIPKKKNMLFRKSSIASNEAKWFCLLKGKVLRFFNNEDCDESDQPTAHTMGISAFTRVEAAGNLKFGIYKEDSQHPELASFRVRNRVVLKTCRKVSRFSLSLKFVLFCAEFRAPFLTRKITINGLPLLVY